MYSKTQVYTKTEINNSLATKIDNPAVSVAKGKVATSDGSGGVSWEDAKGGGSESYSTNEIEVGTWIDGKTIYRRVWYSNNCNYSSEFQISADININNIDTLIKGTGSTYDGGAWQPLNRSGYYQGEVAVYPIIRSGGVYMFVSRSTVKKYVIVLDYTKA